jgi:hypothetical protein
MRDKKKDEASEMERRQIAERKVAVPAPPASDTTAGTTDLSTQAKGVATQRADSEGCGGSARFVFEADDDLWRAFEARIYLIGPHGRAEVKRVNEVEKEAVFANLPKGRFSAYVLVAPDFELQYEGERGAEPVWEELKADNQVAITIAPSAEKRVKVKVRYKPRELQVIVYQEQTTAAGVERRQNVESVPIRLIHDEKVVACRETDDRGLQKFHLHQPGVYYVDPPPTVSINKQMYKLLRPGRIMVLQQSGVSSPAVVPLVYSMAGGVISITAHLEGATAAQATDTLANQLGFALFRDGDPAFLQTGTPQAGAPLMWDGLPEDVYTLVIKCGSSIELIQPSHGCCRFKLESGQSVDLSRALRLKLLQDTSDINEITGQVTDANGPVSYRLVELQVGATQQNVAISFTDENGFYAFYTRQDVNKLVLRVNGLTAQIPGAPATSTAASSSLPASGGVQTSSL